MESGREGGREGGRGGGREGERERIDAWRLAEKGSVYSTLL